LLSSTKYFQSAFVPGRTNINSPPLAIPARWQQLFLHSLMTDILKLKDKYLTTLFLKSYNNYSQGYSEEKLCRLLNISVDESENLKNYLRSKGLIEKMRYKGDSDIILTTEGFDYCLNYREGKTIKRISFTRATIDFAYYYHIIDEKGNTSERYTIVISISDILSAMWGLELNELEKALLLIARDKIAEKLIDDTLNKFEEIVLLTNNSPAKFPYNIKYLVNVSDAEYEVEIEGKPLNQIVSENKLAASIIQIRDTINAIFYKQNSVKLLLLDEERNLLDFFRPANTEEEFSHRVASLGQVSRNLNVEILRKLTGISDTNVRSVQLLNHLLVKLGTENKEIVDILKFLGRIRQGYPIHTDIAGVIEGLSYFSIAYPIEDYESSWGILLSSYLKALTELNKIFMQVYLAK
jgi:hypothetical protein